jgi:hypothetical protein
MNYSAMNYSPLRITVGIVILAALAIWDFVDKGREATRWKEYAFLAFCVVVAVVYGMGNDLITSRISWEYFYYGKELSPILGADVPPDPGKLSLQAIRIGAAATWWAGLIVGAAILIANNPSRRGLRLSYKRLAMRLPVVVGITILWAIILGFAGANYDLNWISADFQTLAETNLCRPHRYMAVYGIHLGGYIGGALAAVYAVASIVRERRTSIG